MAASEPISVSDALRQFLHARLDADAEDSRVAYRFITARIDPTDNEAQNWFDLKLVDNQARISYTTITAIDKAARNGKPYPLPYASGGHRTSARPAAVARRVGQLSDEPIWGRALDLFANAALATLQDAPTVTIVTGDEIKRRYEGKRHCQCVRIGDLENSCMRYAGFVESGRFDMYADVAEMAVIICPACQGTRARALVWTDVNGKKFIDRPYGSPTLQENLYDWARENKVIRIWPNQNRTRKHVVVSVNKTDYQAGAYHDSMMFWCRSCQSLSNYECQDDTHDKVLLRSTQAQGHVGWWGRCKECNYPFGDERKHCPNRRACGGCGVKHCSPTCPNECWNCNGCGLWMKKHDHECVNLCITCECGYVSTRMSLLQQHGHCRHCSKELQPERVSEVKLRWNPRYARWDGTCPGCDYVTRVASQTVFNAPDRTEGLIECRHVHRGYAAKDAGHCPGCHHVMRWDVEPRPKGPAASPSGRKSAHEPTLWKRASGRGFEARVFVADDYKKMVEEMWERHNRTHAQGEEIF